MMVLNMIKAKFIDSESVFPTGDTRLPKAFDRLKCNLRWEFVEYYNLVLNKTCTNNQMLW